MAPHSSTLAWKIPWTEKPGGLQSMGSWRVGHDWVTSLSLSLSCTGEGNGNPLQCSCLENPRDGGAWWAAVYGVAQSRTRLKQLSSSSSFMGSRKRSVEVCVAETLPFCIHKNEPHATQNLLEGTLRSQNPYSGWEPPLTPSSNLMPPPGPWPSGMWSEFCSSAF